MRHNLLLFLAALLLPCPAWAERVADTQHHIVPTVIQGVRVFNSEDGTLGEPQDVWLAAGTIQALTAPGARQPDGDTRVVDGNGSTLLPSLIDVHVHLTGGSDLPDHFHPADTDRNLSALLAAGVTTVFDVGGPQRKYFRWQRRIHRGRLTGPHIYTAGKVITAQDGHPAALVHALVPGVLGRIAARQMVTQVADAQQARRAVARRARQGVHAVKIILDDIPLGAPQLDWALVAVIVQEAHAHDLRVIAHVGEPEDAALCLATGVDALMHMPNRGLMAPELVAGLAAENIPVVATLSVWQRYAELAQRQVAFTPLERALGNPRVITTIDRAAGDLTIPPVFAPWMEDNLAHLADTFANASTLFQAGGTLLVGSDSANVAHFPGPALHRELDMLLLAGMSPAQVLQAATWANARWLDEGGQFGAIKEGWRADLLLVAGDPTADLDTVHTPQSVWVGGRLVEQRRDD